MTNDENPADTVIEAAAKAICRTRCGPMFIERNGRACNQHQRDGEVAGRTLHNAGLLADPADRDWQMCDRDACEYTAMFKARAERAEAERDELRADYAALVNSQHRVEADLAALRNRIGSIAGVLRCVDAPAASMIQDALDGGDPK